MKCWNGDHDELRRGNFIYRGAAGRGMGVLEALLKDDTGKHPAEIFCRMLFLCPSASARFPKIGSFYPRFVLESGL